MSLFRLGADPRLASPTHSPACGVTIVEYYDLLRACRVSQQHRISKRVAETVFLKCVIGEPVSDNVDRGIAALQRQIVCERSSNDVGTRPLHRRSRAQRDVECANRKAARARGDPSRCLWQFSAAIICIDRDIGTAAETSSLIEKAGGTSAAYMADVAEENNLKCAITNAANRFKRIDILLNNAGISTNPMRIHELPSADWDRLMSINLRGTYLSSKIVLPYMVRDKGGSIINISSSTGLVGFYPGLSGVGAAYSASKAGMIGFTRQLAAEYATDNIRCNAIAPGFHSGTDIGRERRATASAETTRIFGDAVLARTPLRRLGTPAELIGLVVYLASDASCFVTGQVIAHDGGWTAT